MGNLIGPRTVCTIQGCWANSDDGNRQKIVRISTYLSKITDAAKIESQPQNGVSENGSGFSGGYNETYLNVLANAAYSTSQAMQNSSIIAQMKKNGYEM